MAHENYLPQQYKDMIARLRARSKSGTQSGAEKDSAGDEPVPFDRSVTASGVHTPFHVEIDSPVAGLKMDVKTVEQRRFVHRFIRELFATP